MGFRKPKRKRHQSRNGLSHRKHKTGIIGIYTIRESLKDFEIMLSRKENSRLVGHTNTNVWQYTSTMMPFENEFAMCLGCLSANTHSILMWNSPLFLIPKPQIQGSNTEAARTSTRQLPAIACCCQVCVPTGDNDQTIQQVHGISACANMF